MLKCVKYQKEKKEDEFLFTLNSIALKPELCFTSFGCWKVFAVAYQLLFGFPPCRANFFSIFFF